jgi:5'-3' exonuclease
MSGNIDEILDCNDTYVLVDYSHLSFRNLFIAKVEIEKSKQSMWSIPSNIEEYPKIIPDNELKSSMVIDMYYHLMFKSLISIKKLASVKSNKVVLCIDGNSWRKKFYPAYKAHRKAKRDKEKDIFDWTEFFKVTDELLRILEVTTKIRILRSNGAEGDDSIFVLSEHLSKKNINSIIVSSDKDIKQVLRQRHVQMYDPIKKEYIVDYDTKSLLHHVILGDSGDNIPSIKEGTEYDAAFLKHLKTSGIHLSNVEDVEKLEVFGEVLGNYTGKLVYKKARFGTVGAQKIVDASNIREVLRENKLYLKNFRRNRKLIDMRKIPYDIKQDIIRVFDEHEERKNDLFTLQDWLVSHKCKDVLKNVSSILL